MDCTPICKTCRDSIAKDAWWQVLELGPQSESKREGMSITYESEISESMLIVTASGRDEDVQQVIDYGRAVIHLAVESGATHILCDERNLEYALGTFDTYDAAKQIALSVPRVARVAIVCKLEFLKDGKFWETVAVNRGLQVRIDTDIARAKSWLEEDVH